MVRLIGGQELEKAFANLMKGSEEGKLAVAFWGKGAASKLEINGKKRFRIICNLASGACHPHEIRALLKMKKVKVRMAGLHAKVYCSDVGAIVGSSNASTNGLADPAEYAGVLHEANLIVAEETVLSGISEWFEQRWNEADEIKESDLKRAQELWDRRVKLTTPSHKTLFESIKRIPVEVYCLVYCKPLSNAATAAWAKATGKDKSRSATRNRERLRFVGSEPYQPVKPFPPGAWLIRCSFTNENKPSIKPGFLLVADPVDCLPSEGRNELPIYSAFHKDSLKIGGRSFRLTNEERKLLLSRLRKRMRMLQSDWKRGDSLIPLCQLISD
jgi:HKD family nuclease